MANMAGLGGFLQGLAGGIQQSIDNRLKTQESANRKRQLEAFLQSQEFQMKATQQRLDQEEKQEDRLKRDTQIREATHAMRAAQYLREQNEQAFNRIEAGVDPANSIYNLYKSYEAQGMGINQPTIPAVPPMPFEGPAQAQAAPAPQKPAGSLVGGSSGGQQPTPESELEDSRRRNNEYTARALGIHQNEIDPSSGSYVVDDAVVEEKRRSAMQENAERGSNVTVVGRSTFEQSRMAETQRMARKIYHLAEDRLEGTPFTWAGLRAATAEDGTVSQEVVEGVEVDPNRDLLYLKLRSGEELTPRNIVPATRAMMNFMYDLETPEEKRAFARMASREVLPLLEASMRDLSKSGVAVQDPEDPGRMIVHGLRETPGTFEEGEEFVPAMGLEDAVLLAGPDGLIQQIRDASDEAMLPLFQVDTPRNDREWALSFVEAAKPLVRVGGEGERGVTFSAAERVPHMNEIIENYLEQGGPFTAESKQLVRTFLERNKSQLDRTIIETPLTGIFTPADRAMNQRYKSLLRQLKERVGLR
jgi:hypothetical protein